MEALLECRWRLYTALLFMAILSVLVACAKDIPIDTVQYLIYDVF